MQKDMLLQSIGDPNITERFCCRTSKPLETAVDRWCDDKLRTHSRCCGSEDQRSQNSEVAPLMARKPPAISKMSKTEVLSEANRLGLVVRRSWTVEEIKATMEHWMNDPAYQQAATMKSVTNLTKPGVEDEGRRTWHPVSREDHEREPAEAHQRCGLHPGLGADEDREVQGVRVPGDPTTVRNVGGMRDQDVPEPARGAGQVREMVGGKGVPEALRKGGLLRSQCRGAVPGKRDEQVGDIGIGRVGTGSPPPTTSRSAADTDLPIDPAGKRGISSSDYDPEVINAMESEIDPKVAPGPAKGRE